MTTCKFLGQASSRSPREKKKHPLPQNLVLIQIYIVPPNSYFLGMMSYLGTFVLDFMSTDFNRDSDIAVALLLQYKDACGYTAGEDVFALEDPVSSAGWIFSKLFIAGQFIEKLYANNTEEIDKSKGKKFSDKFVFWFLSKLKARGCRAHVKLSK